MFFLHIKLLGGPPDCFFLTTLRKIVVPEIIMQKCCALSFPTGSEFMHRDNDPVLKWALVALCAVLKFVLFFFFKVCSQKHR